MRSVEQSSPALDAIDPGRGAVGSWFLFLTQVFFGL
jgi:hypothetical protein